MTTAHTGEHRRGAPDHSEVWSLDLVTHDRSLAVAIELGIRPGTGTGWYWFFVAGPGRKLIAVIDDEIRLPPGPGLEVRASGLWTELYAQVDFDHYTVDLEAFGVEVDEPTDLLGNGYGKRVPLGAELEWDTMGPIHDEAAGYECACTVHGELLIDDQTIEIDGRGWRSHWWADSRLNDGIRGFGDDGPVRGAHPTPDDGFPTVSAHAPTPVGLEHYLIVESDFAGWWRV